MNNNYINSFIELKLQETQKDIEYFDRMLKAMTNYPGMEASVARASQTIELNNLFIDCIEKFKTELLSNIN